MRSMVSLLLLLASFPILSQVNGSVEYYGEGEEQFTFSLHVENSGQHEILLGLLEALAIDDTGESFELAKSSGIKRCPCSFGNMTAVPPNEKKKLVLVFKGKPRGERITFSADFQGFEGKRQERGTVSWEKKSFSVGETVERKRTPISAQ